MDPLRLVILGYTSYVMLGWTLLCLPFSQRGVPAGMVDHLFIATSAVSTTGLVTVSLADTYSFFGQGVVLMLIQLGGLGYMTIGSFTMLALSGKLSPLRQRVGATAMSMPAGFQVVSFLRVVVTFTLVIELAGACVLYRSFLDHGVPQPVWQAVFHSVSAFCTAGFSLFNDSFESYRNDPALNIIITVLSYLGAIGFIVVSDVWDSIWRRKARLTLTSKIILVGTFWIAAIGTGLFFFDEPAVRGLPWGERWMASLFQVMTASTTVGFNTIPIGSLSQSSLFLITLVMIIGASPSGTGGGIKTTSFTALWAVMTGVIRRRERVTFWGREIPEPRLRAATANFLFYGVTLAVGIYALALIETAALADQMFECVSALGTVGLSRGITGSLTDAGKIIITALMFFGRVGPAVIGMAFFINPPANATVVPEREDIAI